MKNEIQGDDETTRSGLFFDAIRIIKEMREAHPGKPRYACWENVSGAYSSNGGKDFRVVLEEFCRIVDPTFEVPMPIEGWKNAGVIEGENFQLCWRTLDAQAWGVPQRRKRIYLLFDADGHTAKDIMFSTDDNFVIDWGETNNGALKAYGLTAKGNGDAFISEERHCALSVGGGEPGQGYPACLAASDSEVAATLYAAYGTKWNGNAGAYNGENFVLEDKLAVDGYNGEVSDIEPTLGQNCGMSTGRNGVLEAEKICLNDQGGERMDVTEDKTGTLRAQANHPPIVMESAGFIISQGAKAHGIGCKEETAPTLRTGAQAGVVEKAIGFCPQVGGHGAETLGAGEEVSPTIISSQKIGVAIPLNSHPQDSRLEMQDEDSAVQTLTSNMGGGGGNVPYIMMPVDADRVVGTLEAIDGPGGFHSQAAGEGKYVVEMPVKPDVIACLESTGQRPSHRGPGYNDGETSYTLTTVEKPIVVYGIGSFHSNAMLSDNPESGIYEAETSKTLDLNGGNPACQQGGMAVCDPTFEEEKVYSISKNSHMTNATEELVDTICASQYKDPPIVMATQQGGAEIMEDKCPTITAAAGTSGNNQPVVAQDEETVAFSQNQREEVRDLGDKAGALSAEGGTHQQTFVAHEKAVKEMIDENNANAEHQQDLLQNEGDVGRTLAAGTHGSAPHLTKTVVSDGKGYVVRRLTPTECAKLQGFPTWWCKGLGTENPTEEEIEWWRKVFLEWARIQGKSEKPKTDNQIKKWLKNPYSDAHEYSIWGNGICLQNALFIMKGIAETVGEKYEKSI